MIGAVLNTSAMPRIYGLSCTPADGFFTGATAARPKWCRRTVHLHEGSPAAFGPVSRTVVISNGIRWGSADNLTEIDFTTDGIIGTGGNLYYSQPRGRHVDVPPLRRCLRAA